MKFSKKSLGQNFLIDQNIKKKIIRLTEIKNRNIIEIGPGRGALTDEIIKNQPKSLFLIEKDVNLAKELKIKYNQHRNIKIICKDILKYDLEKILMKNSLIIGNLPYNISSQILVKILKLKWPPKFQDLVLMFQKELGEKIIGNFPSTEYGRLSILRNYRLKIENKFLVSSNCFFPKPKVTSMVIHFKPKNKHLAKIRNIKNLEKITNIIFSNKRKMINKNIKKILNNEEIEIIQGLDVKMRPADIEPETYYKITEIYEKR